MDKSGYIACGRTTSAQNQANECSMQQHAGYNSPATAPTPPPSTALSDIHLRILTAADAMVGLRSRLNDLRERTFGQMLEGCNGKAEAPRPDGMVSTVVSSLEQLMSLINETRDHVNALERLA